MDSTTSEGCYPQRTAVPKSSQGAVTFRDGAARKCVEKQCGRNGMPLATDPIGPDAVPAKKPMQDAS